MDENMFVTKLLASLKLNGCDNLDISEESLKQFMIKLSDIIKDYHSSDEESCLNIFEAMDLLKYLFFDEEEDTYDYSKLYKIIDKIDPLIVERNEDMLFIILDESTAKIFDDSNCFNNMSKLIINLKNKEKEKIKTYAYFE